MKKRILFLFCIVLVVNFIFTVLLNSENLIERTDMVALLIGSYIVYWVINIYLYIQIKVKNTLGYSLTLIVGLMVNIVVLFVLIFNNNRARQAAITQEITEIVAGAEA